MLNWGFMMGSEGNPHVFLGLTKGKSPDELDKIDEELRQEYLKNKEFKLIKSIK
ncbi:TPA: hypothetical protein RZK39_001768 [Campylobacter coli]|nr:hypothetical protein [Campylobacter coli]HEB9348520.1 hypothetical protein [Campylobacter coli]HEB9357012.1 hypothetical protein [Campylobacter coli]